MTTTMATNTTMDTITPMADATLLRLMTWLSPAFPVGGFAWSGGLEQVVADGLLPDAAALSGWMAVVMRHGALWNDGVLLAEAWRNAGGSGSLAETTALAEALAGSAERHAETLSLGSAFLAAAAAWSQGDASAPAGQQALPAAAAYPVAVGAVAARHGLPLTATLEAHLQAALSQAVSVAIRLSVCGQRDGMAVLAGLEATVLETARTLTTTSLDDLGSAAFGAEIAAARHETLGTRLFRS